MVLGICRRWLDDPHDVEDAFQATFLILLRKAAYLRDRDSLSNWLFGVSLRVARRARTNAVRRRTRERIVGPDVAAAGPTSDRPADRETMTIVDQEIRRLPEKQQAAVVLCLVQGQTHDAAARELGWPIGTVKSRLASARATLTRRLTRRGVAPSVVVALRQVTERFSVVPLPQDTVRKTINAAVSTGADFLSRTDDAVINVGSDGRLRSWGVKDRRSKPVTQPVWSPADFPTDEPDLMEQASFFSSVHRLAVRGILGGLHVADRGTGKELFVVSDAKLFAVSPDEKTLAVQLPGRRTACKFLWDGQLIKNDLDGSILLLDSATGNKKLRIEVPGPAVWAMAFSPDAKTLAATTGWEQGRIHLYNTATGRETRTITTPPLRKSALTFTPDGSSIITGMADTSLLVWDLRPIREECELVGDRL